MIIPVSPKEIEQLIPDLKIESYPIDGTRSIISHASLHGVLVSSSTSTAYDHNEYDSEKGTEVSAHKVKKSSFGKLLFAEHYRRNVLNKKSELFYYDANRICRIAYNMYVSSDLWDIVCSTSRDSTIKALLDYHNGDNTALVEANTYESAFVDILVSVYESYFDKNE